MKTTLRNLKMKPERRNREVLEHAAKIGYADRLSNKSFFTSPFLFFYRADNIQWDNNLTRFNNHPHPEITPDDFLKLGTRFKTEQEFIKEFGEDWRKIVGWTTPNNMDYLFGQYYNDKVIYYYTIIPNMLTTDPLPNDPLPKKEKEDAYIDMHDVSDDWEVFQLVGGGYIAVCPSCLAYRYNILETEDYQRKYPLPKDKISLYDGKYEVVNNNGTLTIYRHGELWESAMDMYKGNGFVLALVQKIEELLDKN